MKLQKQSRRISNLRNNFRKSSRMARVMLAVTPVVASLGLVRSAFAANDYLTTTLAPGQTSYDQNGSFWSTTSETSTPLATFVSGDDMVIGNAAGDFSGDTITVNLDAGNAVNGITINSTNVT